MKSLEERKEFTELRKHILVLETKIIKLSIYIITKYENYDVVSNIQYVTKSDRGSIN